MSLRNEVVQIEEEDQLQLEVDATTAVMKLPDGGDSDSDSLCDLGVVHTWCPGTVPRHRYQTVRCSDFGAQI